MAKNKKKQNSPKQLKIAVGIGIAILGVLGLILLLQGMVDTRNYAERITQVIQAQTNRKVMIKGVVTAQLLPTPTLYIPGLELRDAASDKPAPAVAIDLVSIQVPLFSIFSDKLAISNITMDRPVLELVQAEDNLIHWDWMNAGLLKALSTNEAGGSVNVRVNDGRIMYRDTATEHTTTIENINMSAVSKATMSGAGSFRIAGHDLVFGMNTEAAVEGQKAVPFTFKATSGATDSLEIKGNLDTSGELPDLKGTFALNLENAPEWMKATKPQEQHLFEKVTNQFTKKSDEKTLLPLNITSDWTQHGLSVQMDKFKLEGLGSAGAGAIGLTWSQWKPNLNIDMKFSAISYDQWSLLLVAAFKREGETMVYRDLNEAAPNPIPDNISISMNLKADEIFYGPQVWKDAQMSATIGSGAVTVNQFNVKLQGDSTVTVFGVISPSATSDLRFEGSLETTGKSLRKMLTVFDETAADLPETGFGDFFAHSNMFISADQLRLSEADVKLGDLHLNGGLVAYFDSNPRIEADLKLKNISFDYFRDVWRDKQKSSDQQDDFFLKFDKNMNFSWLKKLQTAIDFKVIVEKFTFLDRQGDNASFRLYAKGGDLGVYDINFVYPTDITKGYFKLNVNGEQPALYLSLTTGDLNTDYFNAEPYKKPDVPVVIPAGLANIGNATGPMSVGNATGPMAITVPPLPAAADASEPAFVPQLPPDMPAAPDAVSGAAAPVAPIAPGATLSATSVTPVVPPVIAPVALPGDVAPTTKPAVEAITVPPPTMPPPREANRPKLLVKPQANTFQVAANSIDDVVPPKAATGLEDIAKKRDKSDPASIGENKKKWSEKLIDMSWLNGFSGELELNVNRLFHKDIMLGNLRIKSTFGKDLVVFKTFSFSYWGGQCSILGSLYGGKVPGFSISFTLVDAQVQKVMASLTNRQNISGQVSVSAAITSSGVNMLSWVSQAEGKMVIIGRNIYVQGINMQGVTDSVAISRTSSDVLNSVNRSIFNGFTIFSVDGNLNIKNGMIRTPGIGLRTTGTVGNMQGELKLVPWTMELSALFQFPAMSTETIPTLTIQYSGTPDGGELKTDTSSLESFVAKRIISQ